MRKELGEERLRSRGEAVHTDLLAPCNVAPCTGNDLLGRIHGDVFFDHGIFLLVDRTVEEFGFRPEGTDGGDGNAVLFQLAVQRAAEMEHEGFRRAVYVDIGDGLISRNGGDIDDPCTLFHIRDRVLTHRDDGGAVEVDHIQIDFNGRFHGGAEFAEAAAIDQQSNFGLFFGEKGGVGLVACLFGKVERDGARGKGHGFGKCLQAVDAARDDPDLVKASRLREGFGKLLSDSAGCARDNGDLFHKKLLSGKISE